MIATNLAYDLTKIREEYGVALSIAEGIEKAFIPVAAELYDTVNEINEKSITETADVDTAKAYKKKLVALRSQTNKIHKEQKAPYYKVGKFIDSIKNTHLAITKDVEEKLDAIIKADQIADVEENAVLQKEREGLIEPYLLPGDKHVAYDNMPEHVWENYLNGMKIRWSKANPALLDIYKKANEVNYEGFAEWFNNKFILKNKRK